MVRSLARAATLIVLGTMAMGCRPAPVRSGDMQSAPVTSLDTLTEQALARAADQLRRTATTLDPAAGYPRLTRADGSWEQRPANQWTSGFFAGTLWYMYQRDRTPEWRALAERWTTGLESVKRITTTHDLGFLLFDSFGHGYLLTGDPHYRDVVLEGARSLATRYNPTVGATQSWNTENQTDRRREWKFPVIVDNLMNLELLAWAGTHGGDPSLARMAESHALVSARAHVRPDGSTAHVALFDPATGALERTVTWQGVNDSSAWGRGQAWAIHGLTAAYGRTKRPELLAAARRAADWYIANMPPDGVPYWDFRHPDIPNTERDGSAGAIAASGLYDLARQTSGDAAAGYRRAADRIVTTLATRYMAPATPNGAILAHSVGGRPQNVEIDVGMSYADYYFVEALLRRKGMFLE
jgi:unsaturated chondroitin disaccharide hydrolase